MDGRARHGLHSLRRGQRHRVRLSSSWTTLSGPPSPSTPWRVLVGSSLNYAFALRLKPRALLHGGARQAEAAGVIRQGAHDPVFSWPISSHAPLDPRQLHCLRPTTGADCLFCCSFTADQGHRCLLTPHAAAIPTEASGQTQALRAPRRRTEPGGPQARARTCRLRAARAATTNSHTNKVTSPWVRAEKYIAQEACEQEAFSRSNCSPSA